MRASRYLRYGVVGLVMVAVSILATSRGGRAEEDVKSRMASYEVQHVTASALLARLGEAERAGFPSMDVAVVVSQGVESTIWLYGGASDLEAWMARARRFDVAPAEIEIALTFTRQLPAGRAPVIVERMLRIGLGGQAEASDRSTHGVLLTQSSNSAGSTRVMSTVHQGTAFKARLLRAGASSAHVTVEVVSDVSVPREPPDPESRMDPVLTWSSKADLELPYGQEVVLARDQGDDGGVVVTVTVRKVGAE